MTTKNRKKLNLSIALDKHEFIKNYSYVTKKSISHTFEEFVSRLEENVSCFTAEQYFDQFIEPLNDDISEQFSNEKERLSVKLQMILQQHSDVLSEDEKNEILDKIQSKPEISAREKRREEFINRWKETFH